MKNALGLSLYYCGGDVRADDPKSGSTEGWERFIVVTCLRYIRGEYGGDVLRNLIRTVRGRLTKALSAYCDQMHRSGT